MNAVSSVSLICVHIFHRTLAATTSHGETLYSLWGPDIMHSYRFISGMIYNEDQQVTNVICTKKHNLEEILGNWPKLFVFHLILIHICSCFVVIVFLMNAL